MATPGKPNRSGILGALLGGLFDPEDGPGQTAYEFSPEPMVGEQLSRLNPQGRDEVLSAISGRYGMSPDLEQLLGEARARYAAALESRGLGVDDYLDPETGERLRYPEVSFSNPLQRAIAMRLLEERGGDALTEIDPDYEGYRLDPKLGYGVHILPPGYSDLLEAERDYDILSRMQRDPSADMSQELLMLNSGVPAYAMSDNAVPSAGMAEGYGRAYYPRYAGQGPSNAMMSGGDAPVAMGLNAISTVPKSLAYAADSGPEQLPFGINPAFAPGLVPVARVLDGLSRGFKELPRVYRNQALGRAVPMGQSFVGDPSTVEAMVQKRIKQLPPEGTDFVHNLLDPIGLGRLATPVVGDIMDLGREALDFTPMTGNLFDVARKFAKEGSWAAAKQMGIEAGTDSAITAGIASALPPQERTWNQYFFEEQPRQAPPRREVYEAAHAPQQDRYFGSPTESGYLAKHIDLDDRDAVSINYRAPRNVPDRVRALRKATQERNWRDAADYQ